MCALLGFETEQMMGRSLNLLNGPKTDVKAVISAIKNTAALSAASFSTTLYARDGSELRISASCVPYFGEGGVLAGCKLQLLPENHALVDPALDEAVTERLVQAERTKRACYRSMYNFRTGLMIHRSLLHYTTTHQSAKDAAEVWAESPAQN